VVLDVSMNRPAATRLVSDVDDSRIRRQLSASHH
ncbi:MAG: hypothetical protein ACI89X_002186, partial [Planctomycetota bacterium]